MYDQLFKWLGHRYIVAIFLATRGCGSLGGALVVYYVNLTLTMQEPMRTHFYVSCAVVVLICVCLTSLYSLWETRHLKAALKLLQRGEKPDKELAAKAGAEAVVFPVRHHC